MGNHTAFDPVRKPPTSFTRVVAELRRSTHAKRSGYILATDLDGICTSANKNFYNAFAHRRGLQKFLVDHAVVLKENNKYYVDLDRAAVIERACQTRVSPPEAVPLQRRLSELKDAKMSLASTRTSGEHSAIMQPPKYVEKAVVPKAEKSNTPIVPTYVLFLTPVQMDVWTTFCVLAREATVREMRVAIAADEDRFFSECASATLTCDSEEYTETVQCFVRAGLIAHVIGKIVEGKRVFRFLVNQEEFHCIQIQKRDTSDIPCPETYVLNGQTLKVWKGFEQCVFTRKPQPVSVPTSSEFVKPVQSEANIRLQMHRVKCDSRSAKVLLQVARGEYFGGLQRNKDIPFSLVKYLVHTGFLKNDGGGKHPLWLVDTDRAFLTRFQLCTTRDIGVNGKFKCVHEMIPADHDQWRKDLEAIAEWKNPIAELAHTIPAQPTLQTQPPESPVSAEEVLVSLTELSDRDGVEPAMKQWTDAELNEELAKARANQDHAMRELKKASDAVNALEQEWSARKRKQREDIEKRLAQVEALKRTLEAELAALAE